MKRWGISVFLLLVSALLLLSGCVQTSKVVCNSPYILVGDSCCLDKDANGVCDRDEGGGTAAPVNGSEECAVDCSACPPKIVTETVTKTLTQYVCEDGETLVEDPGDCAAALAGPEPEYNPDKDNEDNQSVIIEFKVRPACLGSYNAIEVFFNVGTAANDVTFQVKDSPTAQWDDFYEFSSPVFEKYLYGAFCEGSCTSNADFFLDPGKKYLFRAKFDYPETSWGKVYYSNEYVIDTTDDGEYATKLC